MFARILEFVPKAEKKEQFIRVLQNEVLPILRKQQGFLEILPLFPEAKDEKAITVTLWAEKMDWLRYERDSFPKVKQVMEPYLTSPITWKLYNVESSLCEHFVNARAA